MTTPQNVVCHNEEETKLLAEALAGVAQKGDIFALYGNLGAGKSTFSRYFIKKLTGASDVPSPTFTLVQMYDAPLFEIYHYDMYRLKQPEEAYELGIEDAFYNAVNLIEWPERIESLLPKNIWKVFISTKGTDRVFTFDNLSDEKFKRLRGALNG